ncbi:major facilitator superfamily MFS_1 [Marinithermus hydrothermalis DSM 14884]|uniref:Major facilitator superfamily MFS_1 n=1 Tax=Marinithermus hydrothermalis (strain DSM 14884 / JCM 11576 / T1) TaxID=869210 RepID=F2NPS4_MARHT|nr:major facilitator superfamily MFS_1 [Marinithermus hydrothermalis DSM 14884]
MPEPGDLVSAVYRVLLAAFFAGMGMSLSWLFLNFHLEAIGFSRTLVGFANATPALSLVVLGVPLGFWLPRWGYVRSLWGGAGLAAAGLGLVAWAPLASLVFVGLVIYGVGNAMLMGAQAPLLTRLVPQERRVLVFSWQGALTTGAGFFGNLAGGWLPRWLGGPAEALGVAAALFALTLLPLWGLRPEGRGDRRVGRVRHAALWARLLLPILVISLGAGLIMPFLNLYLSEKFNLAYATVGALFAFSSLATMAAMLIQPRLAARFGKLGAIVISQAASLPFILVLAYVPYLPLVALAMFVRGALMNAATPVYTALAMDLLPEEERAAFMLVEGALWQAGWAVGSAVSGRIQEALGLAAFDYLFAGMLLLYALATLLFPLLLGREQGARVLE